MAVAHDRWGEGIGAALLSELLAEATRRGCREVFLEVRVDNPRAQSLYRRYGFTEVGLRRGYYQPSGTDALVMRWAAESTPAGQRTGSQPAGGQRTGGQRTGDQRTGGQRAEGTG
jgi:[ribosomal protein S18]-alanine N-acetyltransferase